MKPIVPAAVVLGLSAPVLQGCWASGMWSAHGGWARGLANSDDPAGKQEGRGDLHSFPGTPPFILSSLEVPWGLSCRWLVEVFTQMRGRPGTGAFLSTEGPHVEGICWCQSLLPALSPRLIHTACIQK